MRFCLLSSLFVAIKLCLLRGSSKSRRNAFYVFRSLSLTTPKPFCKWALSVQCKITRSFVSFVCIKNAIVVVHGVLYAEWLFWMFNQWLAACGFLHRTLTHYRFDEFGEHSKSMKCSLLFGIRLSIWQSRWTEMIVTSAQLRALQL